MSDSSKRLIGSDGVVWTIESAEELRARFQEANRRIDAAITLCNTALDLNPDDAIALGVKRTFYPMTVCATCGQIDDFVGTGQGCACWVEATPEDVEQLRAQGLDVEIRDENDD